ncbi:hypothetical protein GCM10009654_15280 [Streptomyces hebeiensis]|uniref:Uncharacterized protein n=1 Tax=Streptomyces hebeiensis TaxID=229486 RepID=A0ABN1UP66_9ACTN
MTPDAIRIGRGRGGEVGVEGPLDDLARRLLRRAGFLFEPSLRGHWVRLPFDRGRGWENERATWAAQMLSAARYAVYLDPALDAHSTPPATPLRPPTMTAQTPPPRAPHR